MAVTSFTWGYWAEGVAAEPPVLDYCLMDKELEVSLCIGSKDLIRCVMKWVG